MNDPFDLDRFVKAQKGVYDAVIHELKAGRKHSHWMWFIFPQLQGLGHSAMARRYAISSLEEARAYYEHPILGPRLRECTQAMLDIQGRTAEQILGSIDAVKFRSCMTLFALAVPEDHRFETALQKYFGGKPDPLTLRGLGIGGN